jgi:hypothetical protein
MKRIKVLIVVAVVATIGMSFILPNATGKFNHCISIVSWQKEVYDFGNIKQAKAVITEFWFTNTGDEPILVSDVVPSCGCTASDYSRAPILPGKNASIKVTFSANNLGAFNKTVTVNFNDLKLKSILTIKGTVQQ